GRQSAGSPTQQSRPSLVRPRLEKSPRRYDGQQRRLSGHPRGYYGIMTKATESVLADALRLDLKARAELAVELLASLDGPADPDAATAWDKEIQRRVNALE